MTHRVTPRTNERFGTPPSRSLLSRSPRWRAFSVALSFLGLTLTSERSARATVPSDPESVCIAAYESLQESRARGALLASREQAFECASSACPAFIQKDCTTWIDEIEAELPTVSFDVQSGGKPLGAVRVLAGERVLVERVDGAAVELDPGVHSLRFEASGLPPATRSVEVARGRKGQRVSVELPEPSPPAPLAPHPAPALRPREMESTSVAPWIAGAVGVAGLAGFASLGGAGLSEEASLERTCAPRCSEADLRSVRTKYLLADISLGVGVGGLLLGGYLFLAPESKEKSAQAPSVRFQASTRGAMASVRSSF